MADTNMSSIAGGLKNVYDSYIERAQNLAPKTVEQFAKSLKKYSNGGNGYFGAINDSGNESGGAINEEEVFRTIDAESYLQWKVIPKVVVWPIQFSGLVSAAAQGDEESFANLVVDALDRARDRLLSDENRQFFGYGQGVMAQPAGAVASNLLSFTVASVQYLRKNQVVDLYQTAGGTAITTGLRISYVDHVNSVVGFSVSVGTALTAGNVICKQNMYVNAPTDGKEMMGLRGIVDDSTDLQTFQNIDASATREWRARRIAAGGANTTSDLLQRLIDDVAIMSPDGDEPDMLLAHTVQKRKYLDLVVPQKRFADGNMDAGYSKISFNGKEFTFDKDCQTDTIYALKKDKIRKFELEAIGMGKHEGSDTFLRAINQDVFQAYWRHYCNYGTSSRLSHGKITGLAVPAGIAG
jgi:hypothetical protein